MAGMLYAQREEVTYGYLSTNSRRIGRSTSSPRSFLTGSGICFAHHPLPTRLSAPLPLVTSRVAAPLLDAGRSLSWSLVAKLQPRINSLFFAPISPNLLNYIMTRPVMNTNMPDRPPDLVLVSLGIDYGTSSIKIAFRLERHGIADKNVQLLRFDYGVFELPASVAWHDDKFWCGLALESAVRDDTFPIEKIIQSSKMAIHDESNAMPFNERSLSSQHIANQLAAAGKALQDLLDEHMTAIIGIVDTRLRKEALSSRLDIDVHNTELHFSARLTVSHQWNGMAQDMMHHAAAAAGIKNVVLVSEPHCALAEYLTDAGKMDLELSLCTMKPDSSILVNDLGCGTSEVAFYHLLDDVIVQGRLKPVVKSSGAFCGSQQINEKIYRNILDQIEASGTTLDRVCTELDMTEDSFRWRALDSIEEQKRIFPRHSMCTVTVHGRTTRQIMPKSKHFYLTGAVMAQAHKEVIQEILALNRKVLGREGQPDLKPDAILLTGGFATSSHLYEAFQEEFKPREVIVFGPDDMRLARDPCLVALGSMSEDYHQIAVQRLPTRQSDGFLLDQEDQEAGHHHCQRGKAKTHHDGRPANAARVEPQIPKKRTIDEFEVEGAEISRKKSKVLGRKMPSQAANKEPQQPKERAPDDRTKDIEGGNAESSDFSTVGPKTARSEQALSSHSQGKQPGLPKDCRLEGNRPAWAHAETEFSGRVKFGVEDPRDLQKIPVKGITYDQIRNELFPAGQSDQLYVKDRQYERTSVQQVVKKTMRAMSAGCQNLSLAWVSANELDHNFGTSFVTRPSTALESLYQQFFGAQDWRRTLLERQSGPQPWRFTDFQVVQGLIAGFVYSEVLTKPAPWDIVERIKAASGEDLGYGIEAMLDKGYHLDEFLKKWSEKMVQNGDFKERVMRPHAHGLASQLAMALTPHFVESNRCQKDFEDDHVIAVAPTTGWVGDLETLIFDALVFKEQIGTYHEVSYEFTWAAPGSQLDSSREDPFHRDTTSENEVHFTLWPGLRMIPDGRYCQGKPVQLIYTLVEAQEWPESGSRSSMDQQTPAVLKRDRR